MAIRCVVLSVISGLHQVYEEVNRLPVGAPCGPLLGHTQLDSTFIMGILKYLGTLPNLPYGTMQPSLSLLLLTEVTLKVLDHSHAFWPWKYRYGQLVGHNVHELPVSFSPSGRISLAVKVLHLPYLTLLRYSRSSFPRRATSVLHLQSYLICRYPHILI